MPVAFAADYEQFCHENMKTFSFRVFLVINMSKKMFSTHTESASLGACSVENLWWTPTKIEEEGLDSADDTRKRLLVAVFPNFDVYRREMDEIESIEETPDSKLNLVVLQKPTRENPDLKEKSSSSGEHFRVNLSTLTFNVLVWWWNYKRRLVARAADNCFAIESAVDAEILRHLLPWIRLTDIFTRFWWHQHDDQAKNKNAHRTVTRSWVVFVTDAQFLFRKFHASVKNSQSFLLINGIFCVLRSKVHLEKNSTNSNKSQKITGDSQSMLES